MTEKKIKIVGFLTPLYPLRMVDAQNNGIELNILGTNPGADHLRLGIAKYIPKMSRMRQQETFVVPMRMMFSNTCGLSRKRRVLIGLRIRDVRAT
jgi:hypothetical protein